MPAAAWTAVKSLPIYFKKVSGDSTYQMYIDIKLNSLPPSPAGSPRKYNTKEHRYYISINPYLSWPSFTSFDKDGNTTYWIDSQDGYAAQLMLVHEDNITGSATGRSDIRPTKSATGQTSGVDVKWKWHVGYSHWQIRRWHWHNNNP